MRLEDIFIIAEAGSFTISVGTDSLRWNDSWWLTVRRLSFATLTPGNDFCSVLDFDFGLRACLSVSAAGDFRKGSWRTISDDFGLDTLPELESECRRQFCQIWNIKIWMNSFYKIVQELTSFLVFRLYVLSFFAALISNLFCIRLWLWLLKSDTSNVLNLFSIFWSPRSCTSFPVTCCQVCHAFFLLPIFVLWFGSRTFGNDLASCVNLKCKFTFKFILMSKSANMVMQSF